MSEPYTDRHGYPLTALQAARRLNSPKRRGFYDRGRWVKLPAKPATDEKKAASK